MKITSNGLNQKVVYPLTRDFAIKYIIPGTCDGFDKNGLPVNRFKSLKNGDKIRLATGIGLSGDIISYGEEFVYNEDDDIMNMEPDKNEYQYVFVMTDIFGKSYYSDTATFIKQGNIFRTIKTEPSTLDHTTE